MFDNNLYICTGDYKTPTCQTVWLEFSLFLNFLLLKPSFDVSFNLRFLFREVCNSSQIRGESSNAEPCSFKLLASREEASGCDGHNSNEIHSCKGG